MKKTSNRNTTPPAALSAAIQNFDSMPDSAYVRVPVVCAIFSISEPTAWRWVKAGRLPAPRKLGPRVSGFNVGALRRVQQETK